MRVLMVRMTDRVSGAEIYNLNLLQGFAGYPDVDISFLTNSKYFLDRIREKKGKAFFLKSDLEEIGTKKNFLKALINSPIFISSFISNIRKVEKGEKFNLICLQSMTEKIFITPFLKLLNYKIIWIEHGPLFRTKRAAIIKILYKLISNFANKIIAVSKDTEKDLVNGRVNKNKIKTLYIGVDIKYFAPLTAKEIEDEKKKLKIPLKNFVIGFLGTVNKEKGIEEFFSVASAISSLISGGRMDSWDGGMKGVNFLIIGDGPLLKKIKEENKNKNFIFTGFEKDVKKYIGILDILFFPTKHNEGISLSLLETMSMRKVVVARDIGGNNEIINENTGHLYNDYKKDGLVNAIKNLQNNKEKLKNIGKKARDEIIKNFDINKNVKNFYGLFKNLMI